MTRRINTLFLTAAFFIAGCAGGQLIKRPSISVEQYQNLSWEEKIVFFKSLTENKKIRPEKTALPGMEIYDSAFRDQVPSVVIAALNSIPGRQTPDFKPRLYQLLKHKNPVVRWNACRQISAVPAAGDLPFFSITFSDNDWMIRECAFNQIRLYPEEKRQKAYFFTIVSHLDEKNPQTLKEIYMTLKWYDDERSFSFMYKRLLLASDSSELIIIMREMAVFRNDLVKKRFWYLSKKHPDFFVREEANKLLESM